MKKIILGLSISIIVILSFSSNVSAQTDKPYTEGTLWQIQFINTKPGMGQLYLKNVSEGWIKVMRAAKEGGFIMDFKVLQAPNASENDWNLILMYELKNYAMLDGMSDKMEALTQKIFNADEGALHEKAVSRNELRVQLGGRLTQELQFK